MEEHDWVNIIPVLVGGCLSVRQQHMTNISTAISDLPPEQRAIRDKCFHPAGTFVEFRKEEIEQSIPDRFEQMVSRYADRLAVKTRNHTLTYDELNKTSNRVAHAILDQHGKRGEPIALLLENDAPQIAGVLGGLKAGKILVTIDPSTPRARNAYILKDSQVNLIVTNNKNLYLAKELSQNELQLINIDELNDSLSDEAPGLSIPPDAFAFIVYTSGSTGKPKGVVETHRFRLYETMIRANELFVCPDDRLSLIHSLSFASGLINFAKSLLTGASLFPFNVKSEGLYNLANWLEQESITIVHFPPVVFRQLAESLSDRKRFPNLRVVHLSGAPITRLDFDLYKKAFAPRTLFYFHMGTTETLMVCSAIVDQDFSFPEKGTPIGYPAPQKKVRLLDENGRDVGPNDIGEIAVQSCYLTSGYWRQPELTKAKFLPDPEGGGERIYLTGDLGRKLPDGFLIHLGRKDFMVKIRGYRVEIAEVERALLTHREIKEAAAVAWEREPGEKYLAAYIVPRRHQPLPTPEELHDFLGETLPDYMIPSAFMFLESLPLTNGKPDRAALPRPDHQRPKMRNPFVPAETEVEKVLVRIWDEVLDVRPIGINDNFFALGGHSLLATQVISRVINTFKVELSIQFLFESPTVADMAVVITENMAKKVGDKELARMLTELESLSEEEAQRRLAEEGK